MLDENRATDSLLWGRRQPDTTASAPPAPAPPIPAERVTVNTERIDNN